MRTFIRGAGLALAALLVGASAQATSICSTGITTAVTGSIQTAVTGFGKPTAISLQGRFSYGSGGTSVDVYVQTSIDGTNWADIANFRWTTSGSAVLVNVSGLTAVTTPTAITDGAITANTIQQGFLGDRYRCKITSVGTYAGGTAVAIDAFTR